MKKYLATRLCRLANFLDPPHVGNLTVKMDCGMVRRALDKMEKEMLMSRGRRG